MLKLTVFADDSGLAVAVGIAGGDSQCGDSAGAQQRAKLLTGVDEFAQIVGTAFAVGFQITAMAAALRVGGFTI